MSQEAIDAINAISTVVIAIFTVVLWCSTHLLWTSGKKHSERELRAYVFPIDFEVRNFGTPEISAFVTIKNSGQTPAYKLTSQVKMIVGPFPQTDFTICEEEAEFIGHLGPEVTSVCFPVKATTPFDMEHSGDVLMGKWAIYVFGRIDYVDAFDKPRWTTFRTLARGEKGAMLHKDGKKDVLTPMTDKEGNDADRDISVWRKIVRMFQFVPLAGRIANGCVVAFDTSFIPRC